MKKPENFTRVGENVEFSYLPEPKNHPFIKGDASRRDIPKRSTPKQSKSK